MAALDIDIDIDARTLASVVSSVAFLSFCGLGISFFYLRPRFSTQKQVAWIITTITSGLMSLASIPFLWDFVSTSADMRSIRVSPWYATTVNRFFQGYLLGDLTFGMLFYRSQVSILEGWVHHSAYLLIVELAIRRSWSHFFCLCASMEIPTFVLGISTLYPQLRSNVLFALTFFMTRILLHILLAIAFFSRDARTYVTGGSMLPAVILTGIFPLHLTWFIGCIKGFIRRANKGNEVNPTPRVVALNIVPGETPHRHSRSPTATGNASPSSSSSALRAPLTKSATSHHHPTKPRSNAPPPPPVPKRRVYNKPRQGGSSFEQSSISSFQLDYVDLLHSPSPTVSQISLSGKVAAYLPPKEAIYDYVGLGRKTQEEEPSEARTAQLME